MTSHVAMSALELKRRDIRRLAQKADGSSAPDPILVHAAQALGSFEPEVRFEFLRAACHLDV